jgi:mono/diheme cytochrome c family protein
MLRSRLVFGLALSLVQAGLWLLAPGFLPLAAADDRIDYNRQIRRLLSENCYRCHGPDAQQRQAGLRLDLQESAFGVLESGATAIVAGDAAASALIARITSDDPEQRMPPPESGKTLSAEQIELVRRWIDQGAEFKQHWSFIAPVRPEPPAVAHEAAVANPIDRFVISRLEREGQEPSPAADRVTLLRRVTLDLTGLPPTPAEVDAFLADDAEGAYERVIQRLLDSPRYGEHMARYWLDVARYGDTHGLHFDNERSLWKYRDWVIGAYNRNLPFDRMTIEQVAGDLLPEATLDQRIASGFNRCNVTTSEGGSIDDEVLVRYAVDRTETLSTVYLGLTLGCAVCHDHKFDPVSQREFYGLYAFYNAAADAAMDGNQLSPPPIIKTPTPESDQQLAALDAQLAQVRQQIVDALAATTYAEPAGVDPATAAEPKEFVWIDDAVPAGANAQGNTPWEFVAAPDHPVYSGQLASRRAAQGLSQHFFDSAPAGLRIGEGDTLFAYCYIDPANPPKTVMLQFNDGSWEHRAFWGEDAIAWGAPGTPAHVPQGPLPATGQWVRLEVPASMVGLAPGATLNGWAFTQHDGTVYWDRAGIVSRTPQAGQSFESQLVWEAYERSLTQSTLPPPVLDSVKLDAAQRTPEQAKLVRDHFLEHVYAGTRATFDPLHQQLTALAQQRTDAENAIPTTLVMADMPQPRDTFVLVRGQYDKKGDQVGAGVPAVFPPLPEGAPANRLGLAQWLTRPDHPLVARVAVNRLWQQLFGRGIVKTSEDFGSQGELPTHPELLDWLAVEFVETGWDVKRMLTLLVTSNTYRQSSRVTPLLAQRDPENLLLARGPRFRIDAEAVRDGALASSGLLVDKIGGRSVKPYQPPGIWEAVSFLGSNTGTFQRDTGESLYRRSLYTFWKRTAPPPSLSLFDAPSRETCVARRARTNTPLQALVLMNDEQYVEAARRMAERMLTEVGSAPEDRLAHGFRLATARRPEPDEMEVLVRVLNGHLEHFRTVPEEAAKLLAIGESPRNQTLDPAEHAAYTMMANLVLNLDEAITKE